jgi:hypothetical protein
MLKGREETMFPIFGVNFLYEQERRKHEIRQIMRENELGRAYREALSAKGHRPHGQRSYIRSVATGLVSMFRALKKPKVNIDLQDHCPDPRLMSC